MSFSSPLIHNETVRFILFNETDLPSSEGWTYTDPDTGTVLKSRDLRRLSAQATQLRVANKLGLPRNWSLVFRSLICEQNSLGPRFCRPTESKRQPDPKPPEKRSISITDVRNFLLVVKEWLGTRADFVSKEEAERRAAICAACPLNVEATGCLGCSSIASMVTSIVGKRETSKDAQLENCYACGCSNKAQVHFPLDVLAKGISPDMDFPEGCWKAGALPLGDLKKNG